LGKFPTQLNREFRKPIRELNRRIRDFLEHPGVRTKEPAEVRLLVWDRDAPLQMIEKAERHIDPEKQR
jgi:hypothetical protein